MSDEYKNTACIVYPAEYPSNKIPPAVSELHSTIIFLGDIDEDLAGISKQRLIDIISDVETNVYQYVNVEGSALFGLEQNIPVLKLEHSEFLEDTNRDVTDALLSEGIESPSEFGYSPHVTIDLESYLAGLPEWVLLHPAHLWYRGDRELVGTARKAFGG